MWVYTVTLLPIWIIVNTFSDPEMVKKQEWSRKKNVIILSPEWIFACVVGFWGSATLCLCTFACFYRRQHREGKKVSINGVQNMEWNRIICVSVGNFITCGEQKEQKWNAFIIPHNNKYYTQTHTKARVL